MAASLRSRQGNIINMEYSQALEHAGMLANRIGQSVFLIGVGDDYAVLSYRPKLLGGRSIQEVQPSAPNVVRLHD